MWMSYLERDDAQIGTFDAHSSGDDDSYCCDRTIGIREDFVLI